MGARRVVQCSVRSIILLGILSILVYFGACNSSVEAVQDELRDAADAHNKIVQALEAQIALLKWIGGAVVGSLLTAVGILWKSNLAKDATILAEVKGAGSLREQFLVELTAARDMRANVIAQVDHLVRKIEFCPGRREREEEAAVDRDGVS